MVYLYSVSCPKKIEKKINKNEKTKLKKKLKQSEISKQIKCDIRVRLSGGRLRNLKDPRSLRNLLTQLDPEEH